MSGAAGERRLSASVRLRAAGPRGGASVLRAEPGGPPLSHLLGGFYFFGFASFRKQGVAREFGVRSRM